MITESNFNNSWYDKLGFKYLIIDELKKYRSESNTGNVSIDLSLLNNPDISNEYLENYNSSAQDLQGISIADESFAFQEKCYWTVYDLSDSYFENCTFENIVFKVRFNNALLRNCFFKDCTFEDSSIENADSIDCIFENCTFEQAQKVVFSLLK